MQVIIERVYLPQETLSSLYIKKEEHSKEYICKGLEPAWRDNKKKISCIPEGTYWVVKELTSPHHEYPHFRVLNVPGRDGILWHLGNYFKDTEACYLPGDSFGDRNKDGVLDVLNSKNTLEKLWGLLPDKFQCTYTKKP